MTDSLPRIPPEPDTTCTDVCYKGVYYGIHLAVHFMRKNKVPGGKIVATASVAGLYYYPAQPEYAGAKAGVRGSLIISQTYGVYD